MTRPGVYFGVDQSVLTPGWCVNAVSVSCQKVKCVCVNLLLLCLEFFYPVFFSTLNDKKLSAGFLPVLLCGLYSYIF